LKTGIQHDSPGDSQGRAVFAIIFKNDNSAYFFPAFSTSHLLNFPSSFFFYGHPIRAGINPAATLR
jgi:hypothetical protein